MFVPSLTCRALPLRSLFIGSAVFFTYHTPVQATAAPPLEKQMEEIIVSGAFEGRKLGETVLGATVMTSEDIQRQLAGSIGETLSQQPGISSTFFGPGASRPIIRGLGGDRIRVLDSGLGSIDASSTSPDHAVAVEPALAERIEILRGTAMLMYGSSAAGGVVNVMDGRIPTQVPEGGLKAALRTGYTTVDDGTEISGALDAHAGKLGGADLVLHIDGNYRKTDDYSIPGFAESDAFHAQEEAEEDHDNEEEDHDEHEGEDHGDEESGFVANTSTETKSGSVGLSAIFENGFIGMNVRVLNSDYGVPGHAHHEEEHEGEEEDHEEDEHEEGAESVRIALDQTRVDLMGELSANFGFFKKAKLRVGYADYKHTELEGGEVGTTFTNEGVEGRLDMIEKGGENWGGATGLHYKYRDYAAVGAEAFVPPTTTSQIGLYSVKEFSLGHLQFEVGGRFEHTKHTADSLNLSRSFHNVSFSAGAGYDVGENAFVGFTLSRTERAPSTEELFSNGPHLATSTFEVGDDTLGKETATGIEATFNYTSGPLSFVVNGFYTSYDAFIYEAATGAEEDALDVFQFTAADAELYGFEAKAEYHLGTVDSQRFGPIDLHLGSQLDMVRATLTDTGEYLPRIPPLTALMSIEATTASFDLRTEVEYVATQNRITAFELPTDDYMRWNAYLTIRPGSSEHVSFMVRGTNLLNAEARQHASFLKDQAPLPGRNISLAMRVMF